MRSTRTTSHPMRKWARRDANDFEAGVNEACKADECDNGEDDRCDDDVKRPS